MFGLISKKRALKNIEKLVRASFTDEGIICDDLTTHIFTEEDRFKLKYPVRSDRYWSVDHFLRYIKTALDE